MKSVNDLYELLHDSSTLNTPVMAILPNGEKKSVSCTLVDEDGNLYLSVAENEDDNITGKHLLSILQIKGEDEDYQTDDEFSPSRFSYFRLLFVDGDSDDPDAPAYEINDVYFDVYGDKCSGEAQYICDCRRKTPAFTLPSISVDVQMNENGTLDVWIATESCSGEHYQEIDADKVGENVAGLIETLVEDRLTE